MPVETGIHVSQRISNFHSCPILQSLLPLTKKNDAQENWEKWEQRKRPRKWNRKNQNTNKTFCNFYYHIKPLKWQARV